MNDLIMSYCNDIIKPFEMKVNELLYHVHKHKILGFLKRKELEFYEELLMECYKKLEKLVDEHGI